jgi:hypothetical protein
MTDTRALESFVAKWRMRWPEWSVAEVFVPAAQREVAAAWFALLQELTDAAWAGDDPTPGLAKLAWWQEELSGWAQGRRRHPLGGVLQGHDAPWHGLASVLPVLQASRVPPPDAVSALDLLRGFTGTAAAVEQALFETRHDFATADEISATLLAVHARWRTDGAEAIPAKRASGLLAQWPARPGPLPRRILAALARARLRSGAPASRALPPWRALWVAWRAARH